MEKTWTYNVWGTEFYIDKDTGDMYIKKKWAEKFNRVTADSMKEALDYYKNVNKIYQPFTVLVYRAWTHWQISLYKNFLVGNVYENDSKRTNQVATTV